jgi:glycosyltransferase involved in cell wall biosynthesis
VTRYPTSILLSSNAPWASSGYGQQTSLLAPRLLKMGHNVALNCFYGLEGGCLEWNGMHCYPTDNTRFGSLMLPDYAKHHGGGDAQNVLNLTLMDVWVLLPGMKGFVENNLRFASWVPVDHDPCPPLVKRFLEDSGSAPIAMSKFGERMLQAAGFESLYAPHGVDTNVFRPQHADRAAIRAALKVPADAFVVGMVANNQGLPSRKAFPQVFDAFNQFRKKHSDAVLYVHADVMGRNNGVNLLELGNAFDIPPEALRTSDQLAYHIGIPPHLVANVYSTFDVLCMPSFGEGFGIPLIEAQACGIPVITTDWTAMTELCGAGWLVGGEKWYDATQGSFQKVPYVGEILDALEAAYKHAAGLTDQARKFALGYDVDAVFEKYWVPVMDEILAPREIPALKLAA